MRHLPGHQQSILFIAEGESASSLTSAVAVSASTLAEDVRQLAQWCKSADDAREQQERRVEQLERMPPLQAHLKALQDKASNSGNPTHPIPPHPIPSHPIPPHPTPPHFIPCHLIPPQLQGYVQLLAATTACCLVARCTAPLTLAAAGPQHCKHVLFQVTCCCS